MKCKGVEDGVGAVVRGLDLHFFVENGLERGWRGCR